MPESGIKLKKVYFSLTLSALLLIIFFISIISVDIKGVEGLDGDEVNVESMDEMNTDENPGLDEMGMGMNGMGMGMNGMGMGMNGMGMGMDEMGMGMDDMGMGMNDMEMDPFRNHDDFSRDRMLRDAQDERLGVRNEIMHGDKRFKLFEKKALNHKKATLFCKRREGKLAQAMNVDEMQRLQTLLMKARMVSTNLWVGANKKEWKQYSSKMLRKHPNLGPNAMMMGGGPTEMCPALSTSTRSLTPVECYQEFPFVCEFGPGKGKLIKRNKNSTKTAKKPKKPKKFELRKKREVLALPEPEPEPEAEPARTTSTTTSPLSPELNATTPEIGTETNMNAEVITTLPETAQEMSKESVDEAHNIGFKPHIIAASEKGQTTPLPDPQALEPTLTSRVLESAAARMFVKLHANLTVEPENNGAVISEIAVANEFGTQSSATTDATVTMKPESEPDPDQQLIDLFDEQSESMSILDMMLPQPVPGWESIFAALQSTTTSQEIIDMVQVSTVTTMPSTSSTETEVLEVTTAPPEMDASNHIGQVANISSTPAPKLTGNGDTTARSMTSKETEASIIVTASSTTSTPLPQFDDEAMTMAHTQPTAMSPAETTSVPVRNASSELGEATAHDALADSAKKPLRNATTTSLLQPTGNMDPSRTTVKNKPTTTLTSSSSSLLTPKVSSRQRSTSDEMEFTSEMTIEGKSESTVPSRRGRFYGLLEPKSLQRDSSDPEPEIQLDELPILNKLVAG